MDKLGVIACDRCGCVVEGNALQKHSDWHDALEGPNPEPEYVEEEPEPTANPGRTQLKGWFGG